MITVRWIFEIMVLGGVFVLLLRSSQKKYFAYWGIVLILIALLANSVSAHVPPLRDEVTLTALGEKNEEALGEGISLKSYTVDGKQISANEIYIEEGKWLWSAESYVWSLESWKMPEDITSTIVLGLPVGKERTVDFNSGVWVGKVEISYQGVSTVVDTYSAEQQTLSTPIEDSSISRIAADQARQLGAFIGCILVLCMLAWIASKWIERNLSYVFEHYDVLVYCLLSAVMLMAMRYYHRFNDMIWGDDWGTISYIVSDSLKNGLQANILLYDFTPPLFNTLAWAMNKVFHLPHTIEGILWIPQSFLGVSVIVMGLLGRKLTGKKWCGIVVSILTATSASLVISAGYEIRTYSFYFLCSTLMLLVYLYRLESTRFSAKLFVLQTICLTFVMNAHYLGVTIVGMYFLSDFYLIIKRKCDWKYLFSYVVAVLTLAAWIVVVIINKGTLPKRVPVPWDLKLFLELLQFLTGGNRWVLAAVGCALVWVVVFFRGLYKEADSKIESYAVLFMFVCVAADITAVHIASYFVGVNVNRYMISLMPMLMLILVFVVKRVLESVEEKIGKVNGRQTAFLCVSLFCLLFGGMNNEILGDMGAKNPLNVTEGNNTKMAYVSIMDYLEKQYDINYENTGIFATTPDVFSYLIHNGCYKDVHIEYYGNQDKIEQYDTIYYVYIDWVSKDYMSSYEVILNKYQEVERNEALSIVKYQRVCE